MKLSVIIPCYNGADTLEEQLKALASQYWSEPWEVIFADNGSTDHSVDIVRRYFDRLPNLRIIDASARRGGPYALNAGAEAAAGKALIFCDADDEVGQGYVAAMGKALAKYDFVACRFDIEKLNPPWLQRARGATQIDGLQVIWYPPYLPHAAGCTLGVKRSLHKAIGGFDESLPSLHDTDFCFRLQLAGVKLHFVPNAVVHYRYRNTLSGIYRQSRAYAEYNVRLSKRYQSSGDRISQPWKGYMDDWKRLLQHLTWMRRKEGRGRVMWLLGRQVGRLKGITKCRVPPV